MLFLACVAIVASMALSGCSRHKPDAMSFFVTSVPTGAGGSIGGLAGADAHCQRLADAAGSPRKSWRAYLSAPATSSAPAVHARDRIGKGPWFNSRGVQIAANLDDLHGPNNAVGAVTVLPETGERLRFPHDILTGSNPDGTLAEGDMTCRSWTTAAFNETGGSGLFYCFAVE
jgi:hypothetical protein